MNSLILKCVGAFIMIIDHVGVLYYPDNMLLRIIGRAAMPIFAYLLAVGMKNTGNRDKYISRLLKFAVITQIVYVVGMNTYRLNILFTFLLSLLLIDLIDRACKTGKKIYILIVWIIYFLSFVLMDGKLMDYGRLTLFLVTCFYYFDNKISVPIIIFIPVIFYILYGMQIQLYMFLCLPILFFYNGEKGPGSRQFFYWFYPVHLVILLIIRLVVRL